MENEEVKAKQTMKDMVMAQLEAMDNFQMLTYTLKSVQKRGVFKSMP